MNRDLAAFVEHARGKGMDHATIRMLLLSAGWKEKEIVEALAKTSLDMPVPAPPDTAGAREAFFHLLTFAGLYTLVIGVIVLLFLYIDRAFPDPTLGDAVRDPRGELSQIRWFLALVLVSFPSFLWLSRFLLREIRTQPEKSTSGVRRWLTYLTLFAASLALSGDVITLVFRLLEGGLTARFLLKVLAVLLVAGMAFAYYFLSLQMSVAREATVRMHRAFASAASAVVVGTLVWGFVLAGSPSTERLYKFDARRVEDLRSIAAEIATISLSETRERAPDERELLRPVPDSLERVVEQARTRRPDIRDPETGTLYDYEVLAESRFRLCATFQFARDEEHDPPWNHPAGHHCFEFDVLGVLGAPDAPR